MLCIKKTPTLTICALYAELMIMLSVDYSVAHLFFQSDAHLLLFFQSDAQKGGMVMAVSPYMRGNRMRFMFRELPKYIFFSGGSFGGILGFGGFIRCL